MKIINTSTGRITCNGAMISYTTESGDEFSLGFYSDEHEAEKVMKKITTRIKSETSQMPPRSKRSGHPDSIDFMKDEDIKN
jgi:hypothetical protein